jgi:hypothetical protein
MRSRIGPAQGGHALLVGLLLSAGTSGCNGVLGEDRRAGETVSTNEPLSFERWKDSVRFPAQGRRDLYAVDNHVSPLALLGDDEARAYYDRHVADEGALILHNGQRNPGDPVVGSYFPPGAVIDYCIDRAALRRVVANHSYLPGSADLYPLVDLAFGEAAAAWNTAAGIHISRDFSRDETCTPRPNDNIEWYVRPYDDPDCYGNFQDGVCEAAQNLTFVLRPHHNQLSYENREFLVFASVITEFYLGNAQPFGDWFTFEGLLLNAIGAGLGFVGEHNRGGIKGDDGEFLWPAACRDPSIGGIFLTNADGFSVMSHPRAMADDGALENAACGGLRPYNYAISYLDALGASCQYRENDILFYCNEAAQKMIAANIGAECSPVPIPGQAGDCANHLDWNGDAARWHAGLWVAANE